MSNFKRKSKRALAQQKLNAASIVQRLPFHQQLSASQVLLLKITPVWHEWCKQQHSQGLGHCSLHSGAELSSFDNGELHVACHNSSVATILKHQQSHLLSTLHNAGFDQIRCIRIRMRLHQPSDLDSQSGQEQSSAAAIQPHVIERSQPTTSSLKSIEAVQRRIKNEKLSASLKRLLATLKK